MNIVMIPTITLRMTAFLGKPFPNSELKKPVNATEITVAMIVACILKSLGASVIATKGKTPPNAAENNDEIAAPHGVRYSSKSMS